MTSKEWNRLNPERHKTNNQRYRKMNPDKVKADSRKSNLKWSYGITPEDYDKMFAEQNGRCAICGNESTKRLCVDHDHKTGKIRGLLCFDCNKALGFIHDDIRIVENIILYLED
jgi:hypothetical protein